jgi:hypothetical protein
MSSLIAPLMVVGLGWLAIPYLVTSTVMGALTGGLLGRATHSWLRGRLRRIPKIAWLPLGGVLGGVWGVAVGFPAGLAAGLVINPDLGKALFMGAVSAMVAAVVGVCQLGWFWLAYSYLRVRRRPVGWALALSLAIPLAPPTMVLSSMVWHWITSPMFSNVT